MKQAVGGFDPVGGSTGKPSGGGAKDPKSALMSAIGKLGSGGGGGVRQDESYRPPVAGAPATGAGAQAAAGAAAGAGAAGTPGAPAPYVPSPGMSAALTNTAKTPPDVQYLIDRMKQRTTGQGTAGQAIDLAGSKIRDSGEGLSKALSAGAAARGVFGSGAAEQQQGQLSSDLQRAIAGSATDISLGRERDVDQMLMGSQGLFEAPARLGQGDRQLALQQYLGQGGLDLQKYGIDKNAIMQQNAQNAQQQNQLLSLLMNLY